MAGVYFPASVESKTTLQLSNGWKGYGGYWGTPYYSLIKGECIVQGLISGNKWGWIATLPDACRPHYRLIFNLNNNQYTSRVDVLPNGEIHWIAGGNHHGWLSLTGIKFVAVPKNVVPLSWYWQPYGWDYGQITYTVQDNVCEVQGLLRGNTWNHLATLPSDCRPSGREIFNMKNNQ